MSVLLMPPIRRAALDDVERFVQLYDMAGHGLLVAIWATMRRPGESALDVGRQRVAGRLQDPDFQMVVIDRGEGVEAALMGYSMPFEPEPTDQHGEVARPLLELENEALGTWYLNAIATFPEARGRGHAGSLMRLAESFALDAGNQAITLITSDANTEARRLYDRHGYRVVDSRPLVKDGWDGEGSDWLLFRKEL